MLPPSTTRSAGFSIGNPLFHELQVEAKRDSAVDRMYLFCSLHASCVLVHKRKGASTGVRGAKSARWSPGGGARLSSSGGTERWSILERTQSGACSLGNRGRHLPLLRNGGPVER